MLNYCASRKINLPEHLEERFWTHVNYDVCLDDCWEWRQTKEKRNETYPTFNGFSAHRIAYHLIFGLKHEEDTMYCVKHLCNNKRCCNPAHLKEDTKRNNNIEAINEGLANNSVKLTAEDAKTILWFVTYHYNRKIVKKLASFYNVSRTSIYDIKKRRVWKEIFTPTIEQAPSEEMKAKIKEAS